MKTIIEMKYSQADREWVSEISVKTNGILQSSEDDASIKISILRNLANAWDAAAQDIVKKILSHVVDEINRRILSRAHEI